MRPAAALVPLTVLAAAVTGVALFALSRPAPDPPVRLAVLVVFDQLRGDFLERWSPLFGSDGFARLQRDGAWFTNCHYPYATTTTGPGHASMLTGACPESHGIVNNDWFEYGRFEHGPRLYCCTGRTPYYLDPPDRSENDAATGGAPERLMSETVADVLKRQTRGRAKVFGVSLKDRSAILPTGQRPDGAFWFYAASEKRPDREPEIVGAFGTSTYYTRYTGGLPAWVTTFNASRAADRWFGADWTRLGPKSTYDARVGPDQMRGEGEGDNQGVTFPHPTTGLKRTDTQKLNPRYYSALANSPYGNDLLLEFTRTCITEERLGRHDVPDLLVVSFSSNDLIGHTWGPDSHEVLDVTLRSDKIVADLLAFLDARVGRGRYVLGLTADHGVCPLPEVTRANRKEGKDADRVDPDELRKALDRHLSAKFAGGKPAEWTDVAFPWFYLKARPPLAADVPRRALAASAAEFLAAQPHVARTFTHEQLLGSVPASDPLAARMKRSFYPDRCGDVGVVLAPYCIPARAKSTGTTHGAPYDYDTHVPLLVYGPGVRGGPRDEPTTPQALASIFAKWLDIPRPKDAAYPVPTTLEN
jgi:hypothetical protein